MKINGFMIKSSFFFALLVFLVVVSVGITNRVDVNALLLRGGVFFFASGFLGVFVCWVIGNSIEEEIIVMKEREQEAQRRKEEELKRKEEEREANPDHYV